MLSKQENILLKVLGLYFLANSMAGVFINIFLFKLVNFQSTILFNLILYIFLLFWYVLSGWTLNKFSSKTLLRFGLGLYLVNYGLLFLLEEKAANYIVLLGAIAGTGAGNFWAGFNISQYILTHKETRSRYFGKSGSFLSLGQTFGPAIGGAIIFLATYLGFPTIFGYSLLFFLVATIVSGNILLAKNLPPFLGINFSLKHIITHKRTRDWKLVLLQQFFLGVWDVGFGTVSGVLLYLILKGELAVGVVNTATSLIYAGASILAGRLFSKEKRFIFIGMIGLPIGILLFAWQQNWIGVLALTLIAGFSAPFINNPTAVAYLDTVDEVNEPWQKKYHFLIERDTALGIPRILNYLFLFLFFASGDQVSLAREWIKIVPIFPVIISVLVLLMEKKGSNIAAY